MSQDINPGTFSILRDMGPSGEDCTSTVPTGNICFGVNIDSGQVTCLNFTCTQLFSPTRTVPYLSYLRYSPTFGTVLEKARGMKGLTAGG